MASIGPRQLDVGAEADHMGSLILQIWRFFTTFCYFGSLSLDLAIHLFFMSVVTSICLSWRLHEVLRGKVFTPRHGSADHDRMRYSRLLEENSFSNRRADYVWLLTLCGSFLLVRPCSIQNI